MSATGSSAASRWPRFGATLGFFLWNYPRGLGFLGDGGAYLLGFIVAELGILLTTRHAEVSMLAPLLLVAYPVFETLFTMYRRRFIQRRPMTQPDGSHLHTLIYRRLKRGAVDARGVRNPTRGNSGTSPYLWLLNAIVVVPATIWWDNTPALALSLLVFVLAYLDIYWRIVSFQSPRWVAWRRDLQRCGPDEIEGLSARPRRKRRRAILHAAFPCLTVPMTDNRGL